MKPRQGPAEPFTHATSAAAVVLALSAPAALAGQCRAASPAHTVAVLELYTSQGCSSCPPADRWLSATSRRRPNDRLVPLALHVGYWDYIGWKDPFAKREFNARQSWLAEINRNRTVYTPGVFLDAREFGQWRDASAFDAAVARINGRPPKATITLEVASTPDRSGISVRPTWRADKQAADPVLYLALTQGGYSTQVTAGENRGETLKNDRVTLQWHGPLSAAAGATVAVETMALPKPAADLTLVVIVQDRASGAMLQALAVPLGECLR